MQAEELLKQYAIGQREFEAVNLIGSNLNSSNLIAINLSGAILQNANLSAANLSSSKLVRANLTGSNLKEAQLLSADLSEADLDQANLVSASLIGANLIGANLTQSDLQGANLAGANLAGANLQGANLTNTNLRGTNLHRANLTMACLDDAQLQGAELADATLPETTTRFPPPDRSPRIASSQVFGEFIDDLPNAEEHLKISFSPGSLPLQHRWRNNGLSADFMADYFSTFFLKNEEEHGARNISDEVKSGVSFIANELLENAMKFSDKSFAIDTCICLHLYHNKLVFLATNPVNQLTAQRLQAFIQELLYADPNELYVLQLERNAEDEEATGSGLGLLTMVNDYSAKLGWQFTSITNQTNQVSVKTMVQLLV